MLLSKDDFKRRGKSLFFLLLKKFGLRYFFQSKRFQNYVLSVLIKKRRSMLILEETLFCFVCFSFSFFITFFMIFF